MSIDMEFLRRYLDTLEHCPEELKRRDPDKIAHDAYRAASALIPRFYQ